MAIVICPECGTKISSASTQCINCGYPVGTIKRNQLVDNIILDATIEQLNLGIRAYKALREAGIKTVKNLVEMDINQFMSIENLGKKSLLEIQARLLELGLCIHEEYQGCEKHTKKISATKFDWKCERKPKCTDYSLVKYVFPYKTLEKLKNGCVPKSMDEKWFYYYDNGTICFYRSWTGILMFSLILNERTNEHILIKFYNNEKEFDDLKSFDIIQLIKCLTDND